MIKCPRRKISQRKFLHCFQTANLFFYPSLSRLSYVNGEKKPLIHNVTDELGVMGQKPIYPKVKHSYYIKNKGPSTVKEMQLTVLWPERTDDRESSLFELIAQPKICVNDNTNRAKASCDHLDLNPDFEIPITRCKSNTLLEPPHAVSVDEPFNYDAAYLKPLIRRSKRDTLIANHEEEVSGFKVPDT